jgi:hypothetical protein
VQQLMVAARSGMVLSPLGGEVHRSLKCARTTCTCSCCPVHSQCRCTLGLFLTTSAPPDQTRT